MVNPSIAAVWHLYKRCKVQGLRLFINARTHCEKTAIYAVQCFGMSEKRESAGGKLIIEFLKQLFLGVSIKIDNDIPAKNNIHGCIYPKALPTVKGSRKNVKLFMREPLATFSAKISSSSWKVR